LYGDVVNLIHSQQFDTASDSGREIVKTLGDIKHTYLTKEIASENVQLRSRVGSKQGMFRG
jgi:hypothetical protein